MADLRIIVQSDFSGGENSTASPYLIGEKQLQQVNNMILSEHGSLKTRDGTLAQFPGNPETGKTILKIFTYISNPGVVQTATVLAICNSKVYSLAANPWTSLGSILMAGSSEPPNEILNFTNLVILSDMYGGPPKYWDGTTYGSLTDTGTSSNLIAQGAEHMANYGGYLHLGNTASATTTISAHGATQNVGPSSLQASDVNNPNSWPVANQLFVDKDNGMQITGLALFTIAESGIAPLGSLIIFKDFATYQMTGYWGSTLGQGTALALQKVKSDMGCVAGRTVQFCSGFGMIRLTHKGFALFDGVNDYLISQEINNRLFGLGGFPGLDWNHAVVSQAAQVAYPSYYICACPQVGDTPGKLTIMFIYDLVRKAWTVASFANPMGSFYLDERPFSLPVVYGGDYAIGSTVSRVRRYFSGDTTDDGTSISWSFIPKPAFAQTPFDRSYFRRMLLDVNVPGTPSVVTALMNYQATTKSISKTPVARSQDSVLPFDLGFIANNTYTTISGTGPITVRGLEYHVRPKPLGRSVVAVGDP